MRRKMGLTKKIFDDDQKEYDNLPKVKSAVRKALKDVQSAKTDYLFNLFKGNDLQFLKRVYEDATKIKYPDGPVLNEYLFLVVVNHRLHIEYEAKKQVLATAFDNELLKTIKDNEQRILELGKSLESIADRQQKISNIVDLHKITMDKAEEFIRQKIGTFSIQCPNCGTVLQMNGIEHWALWRNDFQGHKFYFVWSEELAELVKNGKISIENMAFALRTSVEGLLWTAKIRKEKFPEFDKKKSEVNLREMMKEYEQKMVRKEKNDGER